MKAIIHRAAVTRADLDYIGSITIDVELMEAGDLSENEKVHVLDITNGQRQETHAIEDARGSGDIGINGAAAHLVNKGNMIIIVAYCHLNENELADFTPCIVHVDQNNRITDPVAGPCYSLN